MKIKFWYEVVKVYSSKESYPIAKFETRNEAERCKDSIMKAMCRQFDVEILTCNKQ